MREVLTDPSFRETLKLGEVALIVPFDLGLDYP